MITSSCSGSPPKRSAPRRRLATTLGRSTIGTRPCAASLDLIGSGHFSRGDADLFRPLVDALIGRDEYLLLADYDSYVECQDGVDEAFAERDTWTRKSILTVARMGRFSSDRAIREYCRDIWRVSPVPSRASASTEHA